MKKTLKIISNIIIALCIIFIGYNIYRFDMDEGTLSLIAANYPLMISAVFVWILMVYFNSNSWRKILTILSKQKISLRDVLRVYSRANLGKYMPGRFMTIATRNLLGVKYGWGQTNILSSSLLEMLFYIVWSAILSMILLGEGFLEIHRYIHVETISVSLIILILLMLIAKKTDVFKKIFQNIQVEWSPMTVLEIFTVSLRYIITFTLGGTTFLLVAVVLFPVNSINAVLTILGAYIFAWLSGFITPGIPGGLGIRETILLLMLNPSFGREDVLVIILIHRLVTILGDLFAYIFYIAILDRIMDRQ